jgi:DNA-binding transcriptional LysR family regulator
MVGPAIEAERRIAESFGQATGHPEDVEGDVRLAATVDLANFVLLPLLRPLLEAHPQLRIELVLGPEMSDLSRREADLAVRIGPPPTDAEVVVRTLRAEPVGVYASASYLEQYPADLPLDKHRWLMMGASGDRSPMARWLDGLAPAANIVFRSNDFTSVRLAAGAGLGVAVLPEMYAAITVHLRPIDPRVLSGAPPLPATPMYLVAHRATRRSAAVRAVWDWLADTLTPQEGRDDVQVVRQALTSAYGIDGWESSTAANQRRSK